MSVVLRQAESLEGLGAVCIVVDAGYLAITQAVDRGGDHLDLVLGPGHPALQPYQHEYRVADGDDPLVPDVVGLPRREPIEPTLARLVETSSSIRRWPFAIQAKA